MSKKYSTAVVLGRFQILHNGHCKLIDKALEIADTVLILMGSPWGERTHYNPFTYKERVEMIKSKYADERIHILPIQDCLYDIGEWINNFNILVGSVHYDISDMYGDLWKGVVMVIHKKSEDQDYLDELGMKLYEVEPYESVKGDTVNASNLRRHYFTIDAVGINSTEGVTIPPDLESLVPSSVCRYLKNFTYNNKEDYSNLSHSYKNLRFFENRDVFILKDSVDGKLLVEKVSGYFRLPMVVNPPLSVDNKDIDAALDVILYKSVNNFENREFSDRFYPYKDNPKVYHAHNRDACFRDTYTRVLGGVDLPGVDPKENSTLRWVNLEDLNQKNMYSDHYDILVGFI